MQSLRQLTSAARGAVRPISDLERSTGPHPRPLSRVDRQQPGELDFLRREKSRPVQLDEVDGLCLRASGAALRNHVGHGEDEAARPRPEPEDTSFQLKHVGFRRVSADVSADLCALGGHHVIFAVGVNDLQRHTPNRRDYRLK
ncbi:hypothetical protein AXG93_2839s1010 [Marchantia polymorpha subsp. ruderalis]|uniref:Uncharacterized protein n=1 Tax=Marchantia polymorpha subsp. ruderalis TaxID=1480154 RepID=A0A176VGV1_MARPO|nr:hypothetical protein AXG93_2839s1010 [Marchantia polymorpha subsp. ruderalis]